ncbi:MAG: hypothetical protein HC846_01160 [Blastocatellia bacterium]|nr:hypothetical protein [Blastocatellia bacterium]
MRILLGTLIISLFLFGSNFAQSKGTSIVIHDNTSQANGGENATSNLRSEIESTLQSEKPCVETMDDQDIRDVLESEREKNLLEGGDPQQVLTDIGNLMGASYVLSVSAMPGVGGSTFYNVFVMDPKTGKTIARQTGTEAKQIADSVVRQLGSHLADNCKPHWAGTINYVYSNSESKQTEDKGAAHASTRNTKRTNSQTMNMQSSISATILPPKSGVEASASKAIARVWMRTKSVFEKKSNTSGEMLCRLPGINPFWKGYSESFSETVTQIGAGADTLPVYISLDNDGYYKIVVTTPGGTILGKVETSRKATNCKDENPPPTNDAQSSPEQKISASSFDVEGKTDAKNRDLLSGSKTLPDGHTKINWNLRLVKPRGK